MKLIQRLEHINPKDIGSVAVLYGGQSAEREVSLKSGRAVAEALAEMKIPHQLMDVGAEIVNQLQDYKPSCVFLALHGRGGEDGSIQGVLEFLKIPYTGSGVLASALALNKAQTKKVWQFEALPTAAWLVLREDTNWQKALEYLGGRAIIKPVSEGSSIGMSQASSAAELEAAFQLASNFDTGVFAESWISGSEFTVSILQGEVMPVIQMQAADEFYTYDAKYISSDTSYQCPAPISAGLTDRIQEIALKAFTSLGCSGWGRVDLMQSADGELSLLEVNTIPGLTSHSLVPMAAKAMGIPFSQLILLILDSASLGDGSCRGELI